MFEHVAEPAADHLPPPHAEHVVLSPLPLTPWPALAVSVLVAAPHADALVAVLVNAPPSQLLLTLL